MWLVADLFERYTTKVAKTFFRLTALEAEANRKALHDYRERRHVRPAEPPETVAAQPCEAPKAAAVPESAPVPADTMAAPLEELPQPVAQPTIEPTVSMAEADTESSRELPMGVRADVVSDWAQKLSTADPDAAADLVEKLRKDKKVRVPELQWIAVDVLDEEPTVRKKADHLTALRERLARAAARAPSSPDAGLAAPA